jgi:hypothetical protein
MLRQFRHHCTSFEHWGHVRGLFIRSSSNMRQGCWPSANELGFFGIILYAVGTMDTGARAAPN